ncbi:Gp49 family protein [Neobacillus sp. MER 74]|uniref:Gp49 family protein n=1 Tax=Neobacillus sp. MER 74 TaxID=2939566 RepID=UPI00203AEB7F|nr:Gp49 family protein [Neobacillus sp. MER 74]MCM3115393.1 Gp49 family protein [Neobacillus sp. MER 74]
MKIYQVKGSPDNVMELLEITKDGKVKLRDINNDVVIETTAQAFEMAFEPSSQYSFMAKQQANPQVMDQSEPADSNDMIEKSQVKVVKVFDRCTVVAVMLPNGFIITESVSSVDEASYNEETNTQICLERIKHKISELEAYKNQSAEL